VVRYTIEIESEAVVDAEEGRGLVSIVSIGL